MVDKPKTEISEADHQALRGRYPDLDAMAPYGFPIAREQYLGYNYLWLLLGSGVVAPEGWRQGQVSDLIG